MAKRKRPLWLKLLATVGGFLLLAIIVLFLLPKGAPSYYFEIATEPAGATVFVNGVAAEPAQSPTIVVASWGDTLSLQLGEDPPTDLVLAEDMAGLAAGDEAYQLQVPLLQPLSIDSSEQAAGWLAERIEQPWPVNAAIAGFAGEERARLPLGTALTFDVTSAQPGSLLLIHLSADNYATVIYPAPNGFAPELVANEAANFGEELRLVTREPLGREWMLFLVSDDAPVLPSIEGGIPIDDTMRAFAIAGRGSPGQALVEWLGEALQSAAVSGTFLETEVVSGSPE